MRDVTSQPTSFYFKIGKSDSVDTLTPAQENL